MTAHPLKLMGQLLPCLFFALAATRVLAAPATVFVSIPPQAFIAERIGGDLADVHTLVEQGREPHNFEPTPRQILALSRASLYFTIGLPFERNIIAKISGAPRHITLIDCSRGITKHPLALDGHEEGQNGEPDPHIWLSPPLAKQIGRRMLEGYITMDPRHRLVYRKNYNALAADLDRLHARISKMLAPFRGKTFYVFHPAFGYFAETYGLHQKAVETGGKSPGPRQLAALVSQARADKVRVIFVQPQFDRKSARTVARAINGAVVPMDALSRDLTGNLASMAAALVKAYH